MEANATTVIADKTQYNTNEEINGLIYNLPPIHFCDDFLTFNTVPDFVTPFSDLYVIPDSNVFDCKSLNNTIFRINTDQARIINSNSVEVSSC